MKANHGIKAFAIFSFLFFEEESRLYSCLRMGS